MFEWYLNIIVKYSPLQHGVFVLVRLIMVAILDINAVVTSLLLQDFLLFIWSEESTLRKLCKVNLALVAADCLIGIIDLLQLNEG